MCDEIATAALPPRNDVGRNGCIRSLRQKRTVGDAGPYERNGSGSEPLPYERNAKEETGILRFTYTIPLDPRTKKNHQMIAGSGVRCPYCKKPKKQFIRQGRAGSEYSFRAYAYLQPKPDEPINTPVHIKYLFYMQTRRKVDGLNLMAAADDLLVSAGILKDDNTSIVKSHDGSRVLYDKQNPRTEIYIYDYEEEADG